MKNRSVVIGISAIQQKGDFANLDEALALMDQAVKEALSDSGNKLVKDHIDEIRIPKGFGDIEILANGLQRIMILRMYQLLS